MYYNNVWAVPYNTEYPEAQLYTLLEL